MICEIQKSALSICANLCLLVATTCELHCASCEPDITYFSKDDSFTKKRRRAKRKHLRPQSPRTYTFEINERIKSRTAKHKIRKWTADSGATVSVINDPAMFESIEKVNPNKYVRVASNDVVQVQAIGTVRLQMVIARLKSRFVVCGYSQRQGLDYERAFSATLRAANLRCSALRPRPAATPKGRAQSVG